MTLDQKYIEEIKKFALQNAIKYNSIPQKKPVLGKILNLFPILKNNVKDVMNIIDQIIKELNEESYDKWVKKLIEIDKNLFDEIYIKKEPYKGLKELPNSKSKQVVMRFAPNPNGPPTIGSSRGMIINTEYTKKYGGKFILRFDDTDPEQKRPLIDAYRWYIEDFKWLGVIPDQIIYASDRLELYYNIAEKLISMNKAYVCFCDLNKFKDLKNNKIPCPHRSQSINENMKYWKEMLSGIYKEKEAVLRIKTDINHKDPALRDWGAFRIIKKEHPRFISHEINKNYIVWPLLDFEGAIEDHYTGTTHIIRGKDLQDSGKRQQYIYDYLNWDYPITLHWGRIKIKEFGKLSTSGIKKSIDSGIYSGWDDPKLPTIRAIRKRGIQAEALKKLMIELGVGETDISVSMEALYAENRKIIDPIANRYFFVWNPKKITIENISVPINVQLLKHPNLKNHFRYFKLNKNEIYLCENDVNNFFIGEKIRLKDLFNIEIKSLNPLVCSYLNNSLEYAKLNKIKIIHWLPIENIIKLEVIKPNENINGFSELEITNEINNVVQFERFGFCKIDNYDTKNKKLVAYYTHK